MMQMFDLIHGLNGSNGNVTWEEKHDEGPVALPRRIKR
jgi:hypothetical protein